jgi:hypothetical protein
MADITVRNLRFDFDEPIDLAVPEADLARMLPTLALSMTMPHLEPYLIRTMKVAIPQITAPGLAEDAKRFSQQEGHHFRNHATLNNRIRESFDEAVQTRIRGIEADLEADYQRFTNEKPLRWNLAYAEGFEAMTCATALAMAETGVFDGPLPGGEIWPWHMVEEIEHRTVAFGVFQHLVGSYLYRICFGTRSQWHYLSYIKRFADCMAGGLGLSLRRSRGRQLMDRIALRNFLRTLTPWYDPGRIELPAGVEALLARYTERAGAAAGQRS